MMRGFEPPVFQIIARPSLRIKFSALGGELFDGGEQRVH
jgi:hypothetical protein